MLQPQTSYILISPSTGLNSTRYSVPGKYSVFPIRQYLTHSFPIPIPSLLYKVKHEMHVYGHNLLLFLLLFSYLYLPPFVVFRTIVFCAHKMFSFVVVGNDKTPICIITYKPSIIQFSCMMTI